MSLCCLHFLLFYLNEFKTLVNRVGSAGESFMSVEPVESIPPIRWEVERVIGSAVAPNVLFNGRTARRCLTARLSDATHTLPGVRQRSLVQFVTLVVHSVFVIIIKHNWVMAHTPRTLRV